MAKEDTKQYSTLFKVVNKIFDVFAGLIAASLLLIVVIQIISRSVGFPLPWTEEMTRYVFIWMIFLGIGMGLQKVESPRVTVFLNLMPSFIKRMGKWIYLVGTIGFLLFMVWYGIELVQQQLLMNEKSSVLLIPVWIIGISVPMSGVIGVFTTIQSFIYHKDLI